MILNLEFLGQRDQSKLTITKLCYWKFLINNLTEFTASIHVRILNNSIQYIQIAICYNFFCFRCIHRFIHINANLNNN
jgi:hypothetical protein